jgi:ubiquinone/menaquinone biosynthesis C-methylase UbiE
MVEAIKNILRKGMPGQKAKKAANAYDLWSESYDTQPGNLMLDLDETLVTDLLTCVDLTGQTVVDVGCGTGRHWPKLQDKMPASITGFDISAGMLSRLQAKFPGAMTWQTTDNLLGNLPDYSVDFLLTTLTIAHIRNAEEAIRSWSRVLKNEGFLLITDFHPEMLQKGGRRNFQHEGKNLSVVNYVHPLEIIKKILTSCRLTVVRQEEKYLNEKVKHYYESQNALAVYERFEGSPIIFGLLLKKNLAAP